MELSIEGEGGGVHSQWTSSHRPQGWTGLGLQILNPFSCEPMWLNGLVCGPTSLSAILHKYYFILKSNHFKVKRNYYL